LQPFYQTFDGQTEVLWVFHLAISSYSQKFHACKNNMVYGMCIIYSNNLSLQHKQYRQQVYSFMSMFTVQHGEK